MHIHSFDALMQVSSASKPLTGMLSEHPGCSIFHITIAALNVVKLGQHSEERELIARNLKQDI